mmetsp:Transcript_49894/g.118985  ORF Transcript_49894/g.118985 Transcript_49894/m.118985 type:complete len:232 (+) Transcript_49894:467-1162(+)
MPADGPLVPGAEQVWRFVARRHAKHCRWCPWTHQMVLEGDVLFPQLPEEEGWGGRLPVTGIPGQPVPVPCHVDSSTPRATGRPAVFQGAEGILADDLVQIPIQNDIFGVIILVLLHLFIHDDILEMYQLKALHAAWDHGLVGGDLGPEGIKALRTEDRLELVGFLPSLKVIISLHDVELVDERTHLRNPQKQLLSLVLVDKGKRVDQLGGTAWGQANLFTLLVKKLQTLAN